MVMSPEIHLFDVALEYLHRFLYFFSDEAERPYEVCWKGEITDLFHSSSLLNILAQR